MSSYKEFIECITLTQDSAGFSVKFTDEALANCSAQELVNQLSDLTGEHLVIQQKRNHNLYLLNVDDINPKTIKSLQNTINTVNESELTTFAEANPIYEATEYMDIAKQLVSKNSGGRHLRSLQTKHNDRYYDLQWPMYDTLTGINAEGAQAITKGKGQLIAYIGSGYQPHEDMPESRHKPGADFVRSSWREGDEEPGIDNDPTDEGAPLPYTEYHELAVSSIGVAECDNSIGICGVAPEADFMHVRVSSYRITLSDLVDGIDWVLGKSFEGVDDNKNIPTVISASLGKIYLSCPNSLQEVVDKANNMNIPFVAAAGNFIPWSNVITPANCDGVITATGHDRKGNRYIPGKFYREVSYGRNVDISAPAELNIPAAMKDKENGSLVDDYDLGYGMSSVATALTSATAALMRSVNPRIKSQEAHDLIKASARPFINGCDVGANLCGAGMLDTEATVKAAQDFHV